MNLCKRWEYGSEFHWLSFQNISVDLAPWSNRGSFWGSGRDALRALISYGRTARKWRRLWVPSYFCQDVMLALLNTGIKLVVYPDGPVDPINCIDEIDTQPGDVVLLVNFFGLGKKEIKFRNKACGIEIIEDHTHDPWSAWAWNSDADWCLVSLRKTLPLPGGGVIWSPVGHELLSDEVVTPERCTASLKKMAAMVLKRLFLEDKPISKNSFRDLEVDGEQNIAAGAISRMPEWTMALLSCFPTTIWRNQRLLNYITFTEKLSHNKLFKLLQHEKQGNDYCPFSVILVFEDMKPRDHIRQFLINNRIYPPILWPLEKPILDSVPYEHQMWSRRMLSIHCDMRYDHKDITRVASLINKACKEYIGRFSYN